MPYRSLDTSRLKLSGTGEWDMARWLEGSLWLPFQEPAILHHGESLKHVPGPPFQSEKQDENLSLALLWMQRVSFIFIRVMSKEGRCRFFNAYKAVDRDRQIGDRRFPNASERHLPGPSALLPSGPMMTSLNLLRFKERLAGYVTDRKDFYHQAKVTRQRAASNALPFSTRRSSSKTRELLLISCPMQPQALGAFLSVS